MRRFLFTLGFRLRTNNNWRLVAMWFVTAAWLLANLYFVGVGFPTKTNTERLSAPERPEWAQRLDNTVMHGSRVLDSELPPELRPAPLPDTSPEIWARVKAWSGRTAWKMWFLLLLASVVYIPIAFRDEVAQTWEKAKRKVRERRGGTTNVAPSPTSASAVGQTGGESAPTPAQPASGLRKYVRELGQEVFAEIIAAIALRKRR